MLLRILGLAVAGFSALWLLIVWVAGAYVEVQSFYQFIGFAGLVVGFALAIKGEHERGGAYDQPGAAPRKRAPPLFWW